MTRVLADLKIFRKPISVVLLVEPLGIQGAPHLQDLQVSFKFPRHLRGFHIEPALSCGLLLLHLSRKTTSPSCTERHAQPPRCDPETHSALQLHLLFGFAVRRHRGLLLKVCSDDTPLHHLSATDKKLSAEALKAKQRVVEENHIFAVIGLIPPCIPAALISLSALQFSDDKRKIVYPTSSWIFFSFGFGIELETAFDLPPSKLMYKPPSSFILMPGSMRLDISFLKQIGKQKFFNSSR